MTDFLEFIANSLGKLIEVLNFKPFSDMPITYLELILAATIIPFILKFIFGGFKEVEHNTNVNYMNFFKSNKVSKDISNTNRKKQITTKNGISYNTKTGEVVSKHS